MADFFISYNRNDAGWAQWIAHTLEEAGHSTKVQAWDFRPGGNFVIEMHEALRTSPKLIAVLSEDYLNSSFCRPEWAAAFKGDPTGWNRALIPVKVSACRPDGLLGAIIHIDLVGVAEAAAAEKLLAGIDGGRMRPSAKPPFPG